MSLWEAVRVVQVSMAFLLMGITVAVLIEYVRRQLRPKPVLTHLAFVASGFAVLVVATAVDAVTRLAEPPDWRFVYLIGYCLSGWGLRQLWKRAR